MKSVPWQPGLEQTLGGLVAYFGSINEVFSLRLIFPSICYRTYSVSLSQAEPCQLHTGYLAAWFLWGNVNLTAR